MLKEHNNNIQLMYKSRVKLFHYYKYFNLIFKKVR